MLPIIAPIVKLVDTIVDRAIPDADKRLELKAELNRQIYMLKSDELRGAMDIVRSETEGTGLKSWWRPITMLTFLFMLVAWWFGLTPERVTPELMERLFDIIQIGLGGYVVGRSGEKIAGILKDRH